MDLVSKSQVTSSLHERQANITITDQGGLGPDTCLDKNARSCQVRVTGGNISGTKKK